MTFQTLDLAGLLGLAWSVGIATAVLIRGAALRDLERQASKDRHPAYSKGRRVL